MDARRVNSWRASLALDTSVARPYGALHEVSPHCPLPAHLPQERDLGSPPVTFLGHTHSPNLCATRPGSRATALSWPAWELRPRQQVVPVPALQTS